MNYKKIHYLPKKEEKPTKYKTNKYQPELALTVSQPNTIMETK